MLTVTAQSLMPTRFHPRVDAGFMVKLFTGGRSVVAKATDLSMAGLKLIGPTDASMLSTLEPVVTVALAAWLFDETLQSGSLLGGALILVAVIVLTRSELRQTESKEHLVARESVAPGDSLSPSER